MHTMNLHKWEQAQAQGASVASFAPIARSVSSLPEDEWATLQIKYAEWLNVLILARLLFSLPVSNGKLERTFSQVNLIKCNKRTSLGNYALNDLLTLNADKVPLQEFSPKAAINLWWDTKARNPSHGPRSHYIQEVYYATSSSARRSNKWHRQWPGGGWERGHFSTRRLGWMDAAGWLTLFNNHLFVQCWVYFLMSFDTFIICISMCIFSVLFTCMSYHIIGIV